jgi:hypothetical protein
VGHGSSANHGPIYCLVQVSEIRVGVWLGDQGGHAEGKRKGKLGSHFFSLIQSAFIEHPRNYTAKGEKCQENYSQASPDIHVSQSALMGGCILHGCSMRSLYVHCRWNLPNLCKPLWLFLLNLLSTDPSRKRIWSTEQTALF